MTELLAAHLDRVLRFLHRLTGDPHEAADLAQETFLRAWRARDSLRDDTAARTWLLRIATNVFRDWLRKNARQPLLEPLSEDESAVAARHFANRNHAALLEDREEVAAVLEGLKALPPRQREVLTLHACEQLSIDDIAEVLEIDRRAVKSSLSVARATMRKRFLEKATAAQNGVPSQETVSSQGTKTDRRQSTSQTSVSHNSVQAKARQKR